MTVEDNDGDGGRVTLPLGDSALQSQTLEGVASATRYHAWLTGLATPYLGDDPIELGSGLGDYTQTWIEAGVPRITATEIDPSRLDHLRSRFADDERVTVTRMDVFDPPAAEHTAFVAFNVLEHIPDHVGALRAAHRLLRPGSPVIMFVPAFEFAMSDFDRQVGHVRRYTKAGLRQAFVNAGLVPERVQYVNMPGLFAWWLGMRVLKMTPGDGPTLTLWDRVVVPPAQWLERHVRAPFGQSVFGVARVPADGE